MIATAELAGWLLAKADFRAQAVAKWRAVYWMAAAAVVLAGSSLAKAGFAPLRARISGAKSAALFDPLRAK